MTETGRSYEKSHPWLSFKLDVERLSWDTFALLGEIRSRAEHIACVALRPATAEKFHRLYLAKGVLATTAIEGNTLSEEEVEKLLAGELKLSPSKEYLGVEIRNIEHACKEIWENAIRDDKHSLTSELLKQFNREVLQDLSDPDPDKAPPGEIRTYAVGVARYLAAPAKDCEYLLERLCQWLDELSGPDQFKREFGVIRAILAHLYFVWIHPFADGNGRTARLLEFDILINAGFPTPCAHLLSNHYNETRTEYYKQLDYASKSGGDIRRFLHYAIQGLADGLRQQELAIGKEQLDIAWRNFIHERFHDRETPVGRRQKHLVLDLSRYPTAVPLSKLHEISTRVATDYAGKTRKTLRRDVNALVDEGLLVRLDRSQFNLKEDLYWANTALIIAFQPATKDASLWVTPDSVRIKREDMNDQLSLQPTELVIPILIPAPHQELIG